MTDKVKPGIYRHYKGNFYQVLCVAKNTETEESMVVYQALYGTFQIWARPLSMWEEPVECGGMSCERYEFVGDNFFTCNSSEVKL